MSLNVKEVLESPVLHFDHLDSTNNYAASLIDADKAQHGLTIVARSQSAGKGQRGKDWTDEPGKSLLMSMVLTPKIALDQQFLFLAAIAVAVARAIESLHPSLRLSIKYPNDLMVCDKKTGGILIENVIRGNQWTNSIVGVGINMLQEDFSPNLANATSIKMSVQQSFSPDILLPLVRKSIVEMLEYFDPKEVVRQYNDALFRKDQLQRIELDGQIRHVLIQNVTPNGTLWVVDSVSNEAFGLTHGTFTWLFE